MVRHNRVDVPSILHYKWLDTNKYPFFESCFAHPNSTNLSLDDLLPKHRHNLGMSHGFPWLPIETYFARLGYTRFWPTILYKYYTGGNNYYTIQYLYQYYTNFFGGFIHAYIYSKWDKTLYNRNGDKKCSI